ncbi:hypothetical protein IWX78_002969 [Mycetocola sp. CAN_C7]|uniref:nuclear transport factor 2 family protein n=1 Tax=Mycetocola sp. CAN_C7 TaxID=2787724 RepID=UPI0018CAE6EF
MDLFDGYVRTGLDRLAMEMLVRSYFDTLNEGGDPSRYLEHPVVFRPSLSREAQGRSDVIEMVASMREPFEEWQTTIVSLATGEDFVLAECVIQLKLHGTQGHVLAFSYLRIRDGRISHWHQVSE